MVNGRLCELGDPTVPPAAPGPSIEDYANRAAALDSDNEQIEETADDTPTAARGGGGIEDRTISKKLSEGALV